MIEFKCKKCGQKITVDDKHAGRKGKCPKCKEYITVPQPKKQKEEQLSSLKSVICGKCKHKQKVPKKLYKAFICENCGSSTLPYTNEQEIPSFKKDSIKSSNKIPEKTKKCPFCSEEILETAKNCKNCGESLIKNSYHIDYKNASRSDLRKTFNRIAKEMGDDQFFTKKELNYLPEILRKDEEILAFSSGIMDGNTWLITLTDKRIIFLDKGMIYGLKQSIIGLDKVNAVSGTTGIFFGTITITDGAMDRIITNVWKKTVKHFTNKVQDAIDVLKQPQPQLQSLPIDANNPYSNLEKLASLREKGVISEEEFQQEKRKILNS